MLRRMVENFASIPELSAHFHREPNDIASQLRQLNLHIRKKPSKANESYAERIQELTIVQQAEMVLYGRVKWLYGMRYLDGQLCNLDRLLSTANVILASIGAPQLGKKPEWLAVNLAGLTHENSALR